MMSSALAMVLMAGIVVPGNGPEKVSGEMKLERLDLSGKWEAILFLQGDVYRGEAWIGKAIFRPQRELLFTPNQKNVERTFFWGAVPIDEGDGRFRIGDRLGIYQQVGDHLRICFWDGEGHGRCPASFKPGKDRVVFILRRVKPGK
jgi:hypothetical protein